MADSHPPLLVLTDGEEDAVRLARCNVHISRSGQRGEQRSVDESAALQFLSSPLALSAQIATPPLSPPPSAPLSVHALPACWDASGVSAVRSYCDTQLARPARFDLLYGTDLFYARTAVDDVLQFAIPLLSDAGILILAHTPRVPQLHASLRAACKRHSLTIRYVKPATFISRAEEVERGWTQVEVAVLAAEKAWAALLQSADWQWAEFEDEGRVERQLAEDDMKDADDSGALGALGVCAEDL